jgi:hypothetical protein
MRMAFSFSIAAQHSWVDSTKAASLASLRVCAIIKKQQRPLTADLGFQLRGRKPIAQTPQTFEIRELLFPHAAIGCGRVESIHFDKVFAVECGNGDLEWLRPALDVHKDDP